MSGGGKRSAGHRPQATAPTLDSTLFTFAVCHFVCPTPKADLRRPVSYDPYPNWQPACRCLFLLGKNETLSSGFLPIPQLATAADARCMSSTGVVEGCVSL